MSVDENELKNIPIESYKELHPNSFPFWVFPGPLQKVVLDTNTYYNYPIDFSAGSMLFAFGLANGKNLQIRLNDSWLESTMMFMCLVGRSGTAKTHPINFMLAPIKSIDEENYNLYLQELKRIEDGDVETNTRPQWKKTIISDFTIESIGSIHQNNKRGLGVHADELIGWLKNMNRYNSGSDVETWLSIWSNGDINIDRKSSRSIYIKRSFVSVIGSTQNKLLKDITGKANSANGFAERMLFIIPNELKRSPFNPNQINEEIATPYKKAISNVLDQVINYDEKKEVLPTKVNYSAEAMNKYLEWNRDLTEKYNNSITNELDGIYAKQDTYIHRFALTLQIMEDSCKGILTNEVGITAINGAIEISAYFTRQSKKVGRENIKDKKLNDKDSRKFYNKLPDGTFTTKQAKDIGKDSFQWYDKKVQRFLSDTDLFDKMKTGVYKKKTL